MMLPFADDVTVLLPAANPFVVLPHAGFHMMCFGGLNGCSHARKTD
jgi:hypothetical protein